MEENSKHTSDKKVFIITPEELAKLGILDSLTAEIKNKNAEKKIETPTASTSTIKPTHFFKNTTEKILLDLFKQNKVCNKLEDDKVVFKKPRQASNFNEIKDNATITKFPQTMDGEKKIIDNDLSMASSSKSQCAFNISMKNVHNTSNKRKLQSKKVTNKQESMSGHADSNKTTEESSVSERKNIVNLISTSLKDKLKKNISNRGKVSASEIKFNGDFSSKIHSKNRKSVPSFKKSAHVGIHNNMNTTTNPSSSQDLIKSVTNMLQSSINNVDKNIPKINEQFKNKEVTNTIISSDKEATECVREKTKNKIVILENIKILGVHSSGTSELHNKSSLVSRPKTDHNTNLQNQTQTVNQNILQDPLKTEFAVSQISEKPEIITSKISLTQDDNNVNVPCMTESLMKNTAEEKLLLDSARVKSLDVSNNFENIKVSSKRTEDSNNLEPGVLRITTNKRYLTAGTVETVLTDNKLHAPITIVGLPIIKTPLKEMHSKEINSETEELVIKKTSSTYDVDKEKPCDMYVQPSGFLLPKKRGRPRLPSESSGNNDIVVKNVDSVEKTHDLNKSTTEIKIKDMKEIEILKNIKLNKIDSNLVMNTLADTLVKQKSLLYDENLKTFSNLNPGTLLPKKKSRKSSATVINDNTNRICEKTNVNDSEKTVDPEIRNHEEFGPIKDNVTKSEREDNVLKDTSSGVERSSFEKIPIIEKESSSFEVNTNFNLEENLLKKSDKPNINQSGMVQTIATPKKPSVDAVYIPNETDIKLSGSIAETSKHVGQLLHLKNIEKQNIDEDQTISKSVQDDDCFKVVATDQSQLKNNKKDDHKGGSELDQEKTDEQSLLKHNAGESTLTFSNNALVTNTRNLPYIIQDGHEGRKSICDDYKDIEKEKYIPIKKSKRYRIPCRTNTQTHKMVEVNSTEQIPQPQSILSTDLPIKKKLKRPQKKLNLQNNVKNDITKPDSTIENLDVSTLNLENQSDVYNAGDTSKFEEKNISINTSISNSEPHTNLKRGIKPKSEYVAPPEENIELPMEKSTRGRRHVKINYLELENMFVEDTYLIKQIKKSDEDKALANTSFNSSDMPKKKRGRPRKSEVTQPKEKMEVTELENVSSKPKDASRSEDEEKNDVATNQESEVNINVDTQNSTDIDDKKNVPKEKNEINPINSKGSITLKDQTIYTPVSQGNTSADNLFNSLDVTLKKKRGRPRKSEVTQPKEIMEVAGLESVRTKPKDASNNASKAGEKNDVLINQEYEINTNVDTQHSTDIDEKNVVKGKCEIDPINFIRTITPKDQIISTPVPQDTLADTSFNSSDVTLKTKKGRPLKSEETQSEPKKEVAELESIPSEPKDANSTASKDEEKNDVVIKQESEVNTNVDTQHSTNINKTQNIVKSEIDPINSIGTITPKDKTISTPVPQDNTPFNISDVMPKTKRGRPRKSEVTKEVTELESVTRKPKDASNTPSNAEEKNYVNINQECEVNTNVDIQHSTNIDEKQNVVIEKGEIDPINSIGTITPKDQTIYTPVPLDDYLKNKEGDKERSYSTENLVKDPSELDLETEERPLLKRIAGKSTFTSFNDKPLVCDTSNSISDDYTHDESIKNETEIPPFRRRWRIPYRKNIKIAKERNKITQQKLEPIDLRNNVEINISSKQNSTIENLVNNSLELDQSEVHNDCDNSIFEEKSNNSLNLSSGNSEPPKKKQKSRKQKSEYVTPPKEVIELPMEQSLRGRRHVRINYFELENRFKEDNNDFITNIKKPDKGNTQGDTLLNSSVTPKKKRGRPRKSELTLPEEKLEVSEGESVVSKSHDDYGTGSKVEEKNDVLVNKESKNNSKSTDIQHIEDANKISDEANIIKTSSDEPNKNKRGRPRKALQPGAEITLPMDKPETSSTCNQSDQTEDSYHIENEVNIKTLDDEVNSIPSTSFDSPASTVKKRGRPRKDHFKDIELMEIESKRGSRQSVTYSETKNQLDEDSVEEIGFIKKRKRKISSSDQEIIDEPVEKPKYVYTGRYTKLINDVFTAAVSKSDDTEENPNANINFQPRVCGRPKKNTEPAISVDDNGQVTCVPCQIKIPEEEWIDHNENKHANLSWREGEHVVLLDQPSLLKDKLKPLLKKNGSLTCTKCKQKFMKILPFISHTEECIGIVVNGNVTCSSCNKSMPKKDWSHHKIRHNNMTWRVGEHPLDLNNETFVLTTLNALYKAKKPLYCEKCGIVKKSVVGLLSHLGQCGNTEQAKIECELCGKKVLPVSLPTHIKLAHETAKKVETTSNYFQVDLEVSQKRRKAATKAMAKIDEFSSDTKETLTHFIINMKFEDNDLLMAFINKELEENNFVKCKISTCEFSSVKILDALSHLKDCSLKLDQRYTCKTCFLTEPTEEDIIDHLQKVHNLEMKQEDPEYVYNDEDNNVHDFFLDDENALERPKKRKRYLRTQPYKDTSNLKLKPRFIHLVSRGKYADSNLFSHAFEYAFEFCEKNYNIKSLFDDLKCDECFWNLIDDEHLEKYMPLYELSCDVVIRKVKGLKSKSIFKDEIGFKKYELFEVEQQDARTTIFCGAPVRCLAWMPTPYESLNQPQILAVATSKHFDEKYNHLKHYSETTVIQFWNFGLLQNGKDITEPKLEFCLGVDNGPVWCMEWCPSGCYNVDGSIVWSRRGLLAVAGHSMPVHIYSIPLLTEAQCGLFYKAKPVLKLQLVKDDTNLKRLLFPTKLSWSKVSGHNHIAVGYSDGTVALYNLNTSSKLLRFIDKSSVDVLMPYKILKTHSHYISAISFIPIGQGNRWLLTSSFDKAVHLWDLYTDDKISLKKGKLASDVVWLTQWLSFITGGDESTAVGQAVAVTNSHREYLYDVHTLSYSLSSFTSISTSDWLNAFIHGNENGEIVISLLHQMLYEMGRLRKSNDYRYILGYSKLIDKTLSPEERATVEEEKKKVLKVLPRQRRKLQEASDGNSHYHWYEPYEYEEATAKYGLMFCDTADLYKLSSTYQDTEPVKSNLYPLMAINQVSLNPNQQASLFLATGYQIGFVRVSYLKFLEDDRQIRKSKS